MIEVKCDKDECCEMALSGRSFDLLLEFIVITVNLTKEISKEFNLNEKQVFEAVSELVKEKIKEVGK